MSLLSILLLFRLIVVNVCLKSVYKDDDDGDDGLTLTYRVTCETMHKSLYSDLFEFIIAEVKCRKDLIGM